MTPEDEKEVAASTERMRLVVDKAIGPALAGLRAMRAGATAAGFTFAPDFADRSELLGNQTVAPRRAKGEDDGR